METFKNILDLIGFSTYIQPLASIFVMSLGMSYMCMIFHIANTRVSRHRVAAVTIILSACLFCLDDGYNFLPEWVEPILFLIGCSTILYTIFGKDLYARLDNFLDDKFGENSSDTGDAYLTKYDRNRKKLEIEQNADKPLSTTESKTQVTVVDTTGVGNTRQASEYRDTVRTKRSRKQVITDEFIGK